MPENYRLIPQWRYREIGNEDWSRPDYYIAQRHVGGGYVEEAPADAQGNILGAWQRQYAPAAGGDEGVWKSFQSELLSNPAVTLPALLLGAQAAGFVPGADAVQPGVFGGTQAASATPASYATWEGDDAVLGDSFRRNSVDSIYNTWEADDAALGKTWSNLGPSLVPGAAAAAGAAAATKAGTSALENELLQKSRTEQLDSLAKGGSSLMSGAAGAAGATALSKILSGEGKLEDVLSVLGQAAPAALGAYAANEQTEALTDLSEKYMALGAPSRGRYEASFAPGFSMASDPGYQDALDQSAKATLHGLSVTGSPAGSPNAWAQSLSDLYGKTAYPALQTYRQTNANTGGYGAFNASAPGAAKDAIGSEANMWNAVGYGAGNVLNPPKETSLADILKRLNVNDLFSVAR